ncbi:D-tyrosyl-tRNA(Tyr) deacylase [Scopulibacillus darangshiensis]|uniref:D-aminoacyl-tRNA deacylase n=1 Tax=Scopulibacillus darangshiensis TaxID=442528 RepID=A0A4R2PDT4_9BACL|nr:D-aminoacyl-tRNA deacylase [Scopulibacillus darangshiensis]TCP32271.1 D-tyrosyl-tRNA(Tyr) deacylase [Scopulibacillus darangshiensis]
MRVVVQRAKNASVSVEKTIVGQIEHGLMLLVGFKHDDNEQDLKYVADKIAGLRIFEDADGKMNDSVIDVEGHILSVSQFTLYGDVSKGRRPSFTEAARPEQAKALYEAFNQLLAEKGLTVETGIFGAMMDVSFTNDGPVTIIVESKG